MKSRGLLGLVVISCLILVMVALSFSVACAPAQTPTPTLTSPPATEPTEVTLRVGAPMLVGPPGTSVYEWQASCEEVTAKTDGRVKFEYYWGGVLAEKTEELEAVKAGVYDIAWFNPVTFADKLPLNSITIAVPFQPTNEYHALEAGLKLYENPAILDEWEPWNIKIIGVMCNPSKNVLCTKPLRTLDDIKGVKCWLSGSTDPKLWEAAGGVPVFFSWGEIWESLDRGTIEATCSDEAVLMEMSFYEVAKYFHPGITFAAYIAPVEMNLGSFNRLSPGDQEILLETFAVAGSSMNENRSILLEDIRKQLEDYGVEYIDFPAQEMEKWQNMPEALAISDEWVEDKESKGLPGRELMEFWKKALGLSS